MPPPWQVCQALHSPCATCPRGFLRAKACPKRYRHAHLPSQACSPDSMTKRPKSSASVARPLPSAAGMATCRAQGREPQWAWGRVCSEMGSCAGVQARADRNRPHLEISGAAQTAPTARPARALRLSCNAKASVQLYRNKRNPALGASSSRCSFSLGRLCSAAAAYCEARRRARSSCARRNQW